MRKEFSEMRDQIQEVKTSLPCSSSWPSLQKKVVQTIIDQPAYVALPEQATSQHARAELPAKSQGKQSQRSVSVPLQSLNHVNQTTDTVASSVSCKIDTIEVAASTRLDYKKNAYTPETSGNDGFQVVTKKKKHKAVIGTSRNSTILQAAKNRQSSVFLSRLSPETTCDHIKNFAKTSLNIDVTCEKLETRYNTYSSFRVDGICSDPNVMYNPDKWPCGVLVRKFYVKRS